MKTILVISTALCILFIAQQGRADNNMVFPQEKNTAYTPETVLPAGIDSTDITNPYTGEQAPARKATVAATLNNIVLLNRLLKEDVSPVNNEQVQKIVQTVRDLIPSLKVIGVFNLFTIDEWLTTNDQPGRVLIGILYLQTYPSEITSKVKSTLTNLQQTTNMKYLSNEIERALKHN